MALVVILVMTALVLLLCRHKPSRNGVAQPSGFDARQSVGSRAEFVSRGAHTEHHGMHLGYSVIPRQLARLFTCILRLTAHKIGKDSSRFGNEKATPHVGQSPLDALVNWVNDPPTTAVPTAADSLAETSERLQCCGNPPATTSPIVNSPSPSSASPTSPISIRKRLLANGFWHGQTIPRVSSPLSTSSISVDPLATRSDESPEQARRGKSPTTPMTDAPLPGFARPGFRPSRPPVPRVLNKGLRLHAYGSGSHTVLPTHPQPSYAGPIATAPALSIAPSVVATPSPRNWNDGTVPAGIHPFAPPALHAPGLSHGARPPAPIHPFSAGHDTAARGALSVHPALSLLRVRTGNCSVSLLSVTSPSSRVATTSLPAARPAVLSNPTGSLPELLLVRSDNVQRVTVDQSAQGWGSPSFDPPPVCTPAPTSPKLIEAMLTPSASLRSSGFAGGLSVQTAVGRGF